MEKIDWIQQRMTRFKIYGQTLPGATVYFREDWQVIYFDLMGKQFGLMSKEANEESKLTLKNTPELNEELREIYPESIVPGYYANKKHWNSILLSSDSLTDESIEKLIYQSYELVKKKLTKKEKIQLEE